MIVVVALIFVAAIAVGVAYAAPERVEARRRKRLRADLRVALRARGRR